MADTPRQGQGTKKTEFGGSGAGGAATTTQKGNQGPTYGSQERQGGQGQRPPSPYGGQSGGQQSGGQSGGRNVAGGQGNISGSNVDREGGRGEGQFGGEGGRESGREGGRNPTGKKGRMGGEEEEE